MYACINALGVAAPDDLARAATFEAVFWILAASAGASLLIDKAPGSLVKTLLVIILFVFVFEITIANRAHYNNIWSGDKAGLSYNFMKQELSQYGADISMQGISYYPEYESFVGEGDNLSVTFGGLDRSVGSIYIEPNFDIITDENFKLMQYQVIFSDKDMTSKGTPANNLVRNLPESNHAEINPMGAVSSLTITFSGTVIFKSITLNAVIPLSVYTLRILILTLIAFAIYLLVTRDFSVLLFDNKSVRQNLGFLTLIVLLAAISLFITASASVTEENSAFAYPYDYMVDALQEGRLNLDMNIPEALKTMENPYDFSARSALGIPYFADQGNGALEFWDDAFYNGKVYMQHGIVPVVLMYLPYHILTGNYLPNAVAISFFTIAAGIFLMLLWRAISVKFLNKMPYVFFMCGAAAVYCCSLITVNLHMLRKYEMSSAAGIMFVALGMYLLFQAVFKKENLSYVRLGFSAFSLALSVGCRPSMLLSSVILVVLLLPTIIKSGKKTAITTIAVTIVPYIVVAIPLMLYNYFRFDSIFEFGGSYIISTPSLMALKQVNPAGKFLMLLQGVRDNIFAPLSLLDIFPFVNGSTVTRGFEYPSVFYNGVAGIINFPVMWLLCTILIAFRKLKEVSPELRRVLIALPITAICIAGIASAMVGMAFRYQVDYMWMFALAALICAYFVWERFENKALITKLLSSAFVISALPCLLIPSESGGMIFKPEIYYYLSRVFSLY
ncbi:MAG: hypothetical protein LBM98_06335 [Oscillospiraceae bacterium]|nr:hypothetical protein [Oscillospiraceae bacterium]